MGKRNAGIDLLKLVFACLIPLLHIPFEEKGLVAFFEQYVARMGVPFFFAASGYFLQQSIEKRGSYEALKRFCCRIGKLLGIWLLIDMPLILVLTDKHDVTFLQELLFRTPAYLWYLTAMLAASIPFCLVKFNSCIICIGLYVVGALLGDTYAWWLGGWPAYERIFLTTRNGVFFAYPLMYVGKIVYNNKKRGNPKRKSDSNHFNAYLVC